ALGDRRDSGNPGGDLEGVAVRGQEGIEADADGGSAMILECKDLDRALHTPELMPDMRAHAAQCAECSRQLHLWSEISRVEPAVHEDWDSTYLWQRIQAKRAGEAPRRRVLWPRWVLAAAAMVALAIAIVRPWSPSRAATRELLTDNALAEVQRAESAYA